MFASPILRFACTMILTLACTCLHAERIVSVVDGDTIVTDQRTINLAGIVAPPMGNSIGRDSRAHLVRILKRGKVTIRGNTVYVDGKDVSLMMVQESMADAKPGSKYVEAAKFGTSFSSDPTVTEAFSLPGTSTAPKTATGSVARYPVREPSSRLIKTTTDLRFRAELPWRKSNVESGYVGIYRRYNGAGGNNIAPLGDSSTFNETNIQITGPDPNTVTSVTVELEIYNEKHLTDSLTIFMSVLKSIDANTPLDDFVKVVTNSVNNPRRFGNWSIEYKPNRVGYDIEAKLLNAP